MPSSDDHASPWDRARDPALAPLPPVPAPRRHGFQRGNKAGKGNPYARRSGLLRAVMYRRVTPKDFEEAVDALLVECKAGNLVAIRELFDRLIGKPSEGLDMLARIEQLETMLLAQGVRVGQFGEDARDEPRSQSA